MVANRDPSEIHITRIYDAPVRVVWEAWTEPAQAALWWGPRGFTLTSHSKDLRPGGIWHYTMHGPDGTDYPNKALYYEVETERKLVYDHGGYDDRPPLFRVTVLFSESEGKTTMEMTMRFPSPAEAAESLKFIKQVGGFATWDRLAEYLNDLADDQACFVITRTLSAPIERVFQMWLEPSQLSQWLPPEGFQMRFLRADFQVGGSCLFEMKHSSGMTFLASFQFSDISHSQRIEYIQQFCDADEKPARHPGLPGFPSAIKTSVRFAAEGTEATRITVVSRILPETITSEIDCFKQERVGMTQGWSRSFDQLEELLVKQSTGR